MSRPEESGARAGEIARAARPFLAYCANVGTVLRPTPSVPYHRTTVLLYCIVVVALKQQRLSGDFNETLYRTLARL